MYILRNLRTILSDCCRTHAQKSQREAAYYTGAQQTTSHNSAPWGTTGACRLCKTRKSTEVYPYRVVGWFFGFLCQISLCEPLMKATAALNRCWSAAFQRRTLDVSYLMYPKLNSARMREAGTQDGLTNKSVNMFTYQVLNYKLFNFPREAEL